MSQRADKPDEAKINEYIERFVTMSTMTLPAAFLPNTIAHVSQDSLFRSILRRPVRVPTCDPPEASLQTHPEELLQ